MDDGIFKAFSCSQGNDGDEAEDMAYKMFNLPVPAPEDRTQPDINAINEIRQELLDNSSWSMGTELDHMKIESFYSPLDSSTDGKFTPNSLDYSFFNKVPPTVHDSNEMGCLSNRLIPVRDDWPGIYNFRVYYEPSPKQTKCAPWAFSGLLNKLFVTKENACPVQFTANVSNELLPCFRIRAYLVFVSHLSNHPVLVERCGQHKKETAMEHPDHLLRVHISNGVYESKPHHSVLIPLARSPGNDNIRACFLFMCLSTCGSINKRPMKLIFQLESICGVIFGRQSLIVRICSSPGRDIQLEEGRLSLPKSVKEEVSDFSPESPITEAEQDSAIPHHINPESISGDKVSLEIRGRRNHSLVTDILKICLQLDEDTQSLGIP